MIMLNTYPPLIRQCCACGALARPDGSWVPFVMDSATAAAVKAKATHGYCDKCHAAEVRKLKQGRVGR